MSTFPTWAWVGFTGLVVVLLVLDLFVFGRGAREISFRRATFLSAFWIAVALLFGVGVWVLAGPQRGGEYFAASAFIVWTANALAVLGLRPLYFMLAGMIRRFVYLQAGLSVVLVFVGVKFMISEVVGKVPIWVCLPFIATVVTVSIVASLYKTRGQQREAVAGVEEDVPVGKS
jgi:hypothetical protein